MTVKGVFVSVSKRRILPFSSVAVLHTLVSLLMITAVQRETAC